MEITAALVADLAILSEALDEPDADIVDALRRLTASVQVAVPSCSGLTAIASTPALPLTFTAMEQSVDSGDVRSSLLVPLTNDPPDGAAAQLAVIFYAVRAGAFVDLAADLSWMTGRRLDDFALDQHLSLAAEASSSGEIRSASAINQAIGVLIGRDYTPEQASAEIEARATATGLTRAEAAAVILDGLPS